MAEPRLDPYNSTVSSRERLRRATGDISWAGWLRGGLAGVITGFMMGELSTVPVIAGFSAAGLVLLAQLVGNYERAETGILRERLDAATGHIHNLERVTTDRVAKMVAVVVYGQDLAAVGEKLHSVEELQVWKGGLNEFMQRLAAKVRPILTDPEWLRLRDAEDDGQQLPLGQFDEYHRHEMRKLRLRLQVLQSLIDSDIQPS